MENQLHVKNNSIQTFSEKQNTKQEISQISSNSSSSSPSHDFSFTISLQPKHTNTTPSYQNSTNPFALDLSPADEIFFHGHLLPLHLLSHFPVSPRTSTNSYDGFTLPINNNNNNTISTETKINKDQQVNIKNQINKTKPIKSFSLFNLSKWRKGLEGNDQQQEQLSEQHQKKKFLSHALKKYIRMLFQSRENRTEYRKRQSSYSFSSVLSSKLSRKPMVNDGYNKREVMRGKRGDLFSAPASMRTSPTNSGHLRVSPAGLSLSSASTSSSSDSTMEELQAAIQAAIAHCKNSNDKVKDS